jgi:hypothetical protein
VEAEISSRVRFRSRASSSLQQTASRSPGEWLGLVECPAAPYDPSEDTPEKKPRACRRCSRGRRQPWADAFSEIDFEIGNESRNGPFGPWVFEGMTDGATEPARNRVYLVKQTFLCRFALSGAIMPLRTRESVVFH